MGIKLGEIEATQILENEYRINVLERVVELLARRNPATQPTESEMKRVRQEVVAQLRKKYPRSNIALKEDR